MVEKKQKKQKSNRAICSENVAICCEMLRFVGPVEILHFSSKNSFWIPRLLSESRFFSAPMMCFGIPMIRFQRFTKYNLNPKNLSPRIPAESSELGPWICVFLNPRTVPEPKEFGSPLTSHQNFTRGCWKGWRLHYWESNPSIYQIERAFWLVANLKRLGELSLNAYSQYPPSYQNEGQNSY